MLISMPVTQSDLARRLGLSQAAVSLALRGHPRIGAATIERVQALARDLGFRGDVATAALARRRWRREGGGLAYLGARVPQGDGDNYWIAVAATARRRGLTVHHLEAESARVRRGLGAELARRGIDGLLVGQETGGPPLADHDWAGLAVVHCGLYRAPGPGEVVCADLFAAPGEAVRRLRDRGRIGAVFPLRVQSLSEQMLAAALDACVQAGDLVRWSGPGEDAAVQVRWLRRRADVVLTYGDEGQDRLRRAGLDLPIYALACGQNRRQPGACVPFAAIAERCLDLVLTKREAGSFGGGDRAIHLVPMPWREEADLT